MDLGVVGLEGLVGASETGGFVLNPLSSSLDPDSKNKKCYGSGFLKQERSGIEDELLLWKGSKISKIDDEEQRNNNNNNNNSLLLLRSNNNDNNDNGCASTVFDDLQQQQQQQQLQQMLSFSSTPKLETLLVEKSSANATLPWFNNTLSRSNNTGYSSGNNIMHGAIIRGAFTPSQWMELEHQALIYKYITANVPVPSHLLIPIRKALHSAAFYSFSNGLLRPNALGWGAFHLGYSNSTDPEPGRCRRTDGKKWRCSRDAVVDQKYCERHMNRGRHRSRKPVEGHNNGHALTNPNTTTNTSSSNNNNNNNNKNGNKNVGSSASSSFSIVGLGNNASNNIISFGGHNQHSLASDASAANSINRVFMNHHHKHQIQYEEEPSSRNNNIEFGLVTSDSLLNPSQKSTITTTLLTASTFTTASSTTRESQNHSLRNFMPLFSSSPQSNDEKVTLSPLRLSSRELELDPIQMGLGVGTCGGDGVNFINESSNSNHTRQGNSWMIPITWESSMCGPLGEVLNLSNSNNNANADNCGASNHKNSYSSGLNLMMSDGNWDNNNNNSPNSIGLSPSGVLMQKTAFGSVSNSSAGSSPRAENNKNKVLHHHHQEGASLCNNDDLLV